MKVVRSVKPYYFYLICEGLKKYEVGKDEPKNKDWHRDVELYCSKDMRSFRRIPKEYQEKYRKYLGKVGARFVCDKILRQHVEMTRRTDSILLDKCRLPDAEFSAYMGKNEFAYFWHIKDLAVYVEPKKLYEFRKPCIDKYEYCPTCRVGGEIIPESEAEFYRMGESCNTEWYCNNWLKKPPQTWCYALEEYREYESA